MRHGYFTYKGFVSVYGLVLLQLVVLMITYCVVQMQTLHTITKVNDGIDLFIIETIKRNETKHKIESEQFEEQSEGEQEDREVLQQEQFQKHYQDMVISFERYLHMYTITYSINHEQRNVYVDVNDQHEIIRYDY